MLEVRALAVNDDAAPLALCEQILRTCVRQVDLAIDGEAALALFREHRHALVVLDLVMRPMHGLEVLRQIRAIDSRTQVVIVTPYATRENAIEALNLHAFRLLETPWDGRQFVAALEEAYALYQRIGEAPAHEDEIAALYAQLAALSAELERSPDDENLKQAHQQCFGRLRDLQRQEAEFASQVFRENLALKKGSGYASIDAARRLLDRDKNPA